MKMNTLQKLVVPALIGVMTIGALSGCGEKQSGAESPAPNNEKVTITIGTYDRGVEGIDPVTENGYTKYVQENFGDPNNIIVEFVPIDRDNVMAEYAELAAADNLPTILMEYDYPKVTQWVNDGYLQSIDIDAFAEVAPTYYNRMVELGQLNYSAVSGEDYFVFAKRPFYDTTHTYVTLCRMDWLRQIGYDHVPANYAEFCDVMDKLIAEGIAEHPVGGSMMLSASDFQNFIFREYPVDEVEWVQHSSLGTISLSWEPTRKMIKRANAEYNKGYIDPKYYETDAETEKANFIEGKTFMCEGYMSTDVAWLNDFYEANPDAELAVISNYMASEKGVVDFPQIRSNNPYGMTIGFGKDATEEELKAAWLYMEWCTQPDVLYELQHNEWNNYNNSKDFWCITIESVEEGTIDETIAAMTPQGLPQDFEQQLIDNYYEQRKIANKGYAYTDPQFGVVLESEAKYSASLLSLGIEYYNRLVQCDPAEFDALYEELSQEYLNAGYQEIIDERKAAYEAGNTTKLPF